MPEIEHPSAIAFERRLPNKDTIKVIVIVIAIVLSCWFLVKYLSKF